MPTLLYPANRARRAFVLATLILVAGLVRAQDDLPPGFKPDPNNPFNDGDGKGKSKPAPQPGAPQSMPYQPGFPPGMGGPFGAAAVPLNPPLETQCEGLPIDSSQSANATLNYLDHAVQRHMKVSSYSSVQAGQVYINYEVNYQPGLGEALVPMMAKFGAANLQEAIRLKPSPRADVGIVDSELTQFETQILQSALQQVSAAANPAPATATTVPGLPHALNPPAPPTNAAPSSFGGLTQPGATGQLSDDELLHKLSLAAQLHQVTASPNIVFQALDSTNPAIEAALTDILQHWITEADGKAAHESGGSLDSVMMEGLSRKSPVGRTLFPQWAAMKARLFRRTRLDDPDTFENATTLANLRTSILQNPHLAGVGPVRDGITGMVSDLNALPDVGDSCDALAAFFGDAKAFQELLLADKNQPLPKNPHLRDGKWVNMDGTPGEEPIHYMLGKWLTLQGRSAEGPPPVNLNGGDVHDPVKVIIAAAALLAVTNYSGMGPKEAGILNHLDHAVYADGEWTVTDPSFLGGTAVAPQAVPGSPGPVSPSTPRTGP